MSPSANEDEARFYAYLVARIQKARELAGMSQAEVAKMLGMSAPGYGNYEREAARVSLWLLIQLSRIFNQPLEYFLPSEYLFASQKVGGDLRLDEQALVAAYRRLDGSQAQAPVLTTILELCRVWSEAGKQNTPAGAGGASVPLVVAREGADGKLEVVAQGSIPADVAAAAPAAPDARAQEFASYLAQIEQNPVLKAQLNRFLIELLALTARQAGAS